MERAILAVALKSASTLKERMDIALDPNVSANNNFVTYISQIIMNLL